MRNIKLILIMLILSSMTVQGLANNLFTYYQHNVCMICFSKVNCYNNPVSGFSVKRAPAKDVQVKVGDNIYVSFTSELSDVSVAVLFNGTEIHNESYVNVMTGDVFSYPITEAGEYTVIVSVNGETVAEGTVNVEL